MSCSPYGQKKLRSICGSWTHAKCGVEEVGIVRFQLESRGFLEVVDVLYVP
jgi:hypothetical protein